MSQAYQQTPLEGWEEAYAATPERDVEFSTMSGVPVEPLYSPDEVPEKIGYPGQYPYTRGVYPSMYRGRLWTMRQFAGFGTAEETNKRFRYLLDHGQTGLSTAFDMPSLMGLDSDSPRSLGEVGREGVAVDTLDDMEDLFADIDLREVSVSMTINAPAAIMLAFYVVAAERKGIGPDELAGTIQTDILKEYIAQKEWCFPVDPAMRLVGDMVEYCSTDMPRWHPISISGYHIREAGSTAAQELAFTLKDGLTYVEQAIARGLDVDDFAPRLSFFFNAHIDFFEEIAKYRAARRIWAREMRDTYGAKNPKSWLMRFHTQTAGVSLTAQQPLNNIARTAIEALAGVLGGTQSLHTNSYDEALALPTENAVRIALRTQQIIATETGVTNTIDPLGGSYFVEELTDEMERQAYGYFGKIDELGGMVEAVKTGYPQREIADAAFTFQTELDDGKRSMVGVTDFTEGNELDDTELLHMDPASEGKQTERVASVRAGRDGARVEATLADLRDQAAREDVNLMPALLDCARAHCTEGEIVESPAAGVGPLHRNPDVLGRSRPAQSTGPAVSRCDPSGRPSSSWTARAQASSASRSMPVSWPISCSIDTRSSLATLPVAPAGTGQPPSSPNEDSNERTPASSAASALARPWPRVLWKWAVSSTSGRRSKARPKKLAHLGRVGHAGGVAEADLGHAGGHQAVGDGEHGLGLDGSLVGAAEGDRDHRGHAQVLGQRALGHALQAGQRLLDRPVHVGPVVRLGGRQEQVGLLEVLAHAQRVVQPALVGHQHRHLDPVRHVDGRAAPRRRPPAGGSRRRGRSW